MTSFLPLSFEFLDRGACSETGPKHGDAVRLCPILDISGTAPGAFLSEHLAIAAARNDGRGRR
jgi:hypothetical protein